jgi:hypothetical protein
MLRTPVGDDGDDRECTGWRDKSGTVRWDDGFMCVLLRFGTCRGLLFAILTRFEANLIKLAAHKHGSHRIGMGAAKV